MQAAKCNTGCPSELDESGKYEIPFLQETKT